MDNTIKIVKKTTKLIDKNSGEIIKKIEKEERRENIKAPFNILINNKGIKIKASKIHNNEVNCLLAQDNKSFIDFLIIVVLSDNNELLSYYLFEKSYLRGYKALNFNIDKFIGLNDEDLVYLFKNI